MHKKIEQFSSNSKYIVCHDKVDFQTLDCMVARNDTSMPRFNQLERRDSKKFYQFIMWNEYQQEKHGMAYLMKHFGDTKHSYKAHGALDDALALTSLCTGQLFCERFNEWKIFGTLGEIRDHRLHQKRTRLVAKHLKTETRFRKVKPIINARIPCVKMKDMMTGITCNLNMVCSVQDGATGTLRSSTTAAPWTQGARSLSA